MNVQESIKILNQGNAPGQFTWQPSDQKIFTVEPLSAEVPAGGEFNCVVTYKPTGKQIGKQTEEEKLMMKVRDGIE